jgi:hypothetical protein
MLTPTNIRPHVEAVLRQAELPLSAYQILERLPTAVRDRLINERGMPGAGSGTPYAAATVVSQAVQLLEGTPGYQPPFFVDGCGVCFEVAGVQVRPGNAACAMYRIVG